MPMNPKATQFSKRLVGRYPTTSAVVVLYTFFALLNVALVAYEKAKLDRMAAALHSYHDGLSDVMIGFLLLLLFGLQFILFCVGTFIALFVDRKQLKVAAAATAHPARSRLTTISIVLIFLILPASWLYGAYYWSLLHDIAFQITATPQQKLNRDFVEEVLNFGYDRAKIETYLNKGADVNLWGYHGTPLILATKAVDEVFVNELLARGANADITDGQRKTALSYALEDDTKQPRFSAVRRRIALTLIEHAAGPKVGDYYNPLNVAISNKRDKELITKLLEKEAQLDQQAKDKLRSKALHAAAYSGNNDALLELLNRGANIDYRADLNCPLTLAIQSHNFKTACLLISHGANVNVEDQNGASPLMLAAEWRSPELLNILLKAGASVSAQDHSSGTVLSYAARTGDVQRVRRLISLGAKVDLDGVAGKKVLAAAIDANSPELVKLFIDAGVKVNGAFYPGDGTLLKKATIYNPRTKPEIIRLLREAGARE